MRIVYAYTKTGQTLRFEVEDNWTITFGTAMGNNKQFGDHELRVYSDGKKNQRAAFVGIVNFWEEAMGVKRVLIKGDDAKKKAKAKPSVVTEVDDDQLSTEDYPELYEEAEEANPF